MSDLKQIGAVRVDLPYEDRDADCDTVIAHFDIFDDGQWACTSLQLLKGARVLTRREGDGAWGRAKEYAEAFVARRDVGVDLG